MQNILINILLVSLIILVWNNIKIDKEKLIHNINYVRRVISIMYRKNIKRKIFGF